TATANPHKCRFGKTRKPHSTSLLSSAIATYTLAAYTRCRESRKPHGIPATQILETQRTAMKYILIVPDGMADDPLDDLGGKTPMEVARTPYMDDLARHGTVGVVSVTPPGMYPGSDAANMALLGYDPLEYYTGRGPVE